MKTLNASDAKREFGEMLLDVQKEPVSINKNGKPVAVVISANDYQEFNKLRELLLKAEIQKGFDDLEAGRIENGKVVIEALRNKVRNAKL